MKRIILICFFYNQFFLGSNKDILRYHKFMNICQYYGINPDVLRLEKDRHGLACYKWLNKIGKEYNIGNDKRSRSHFNFIISYLDKKKHNVRVL